MKDRYCTTELVRQEDLRELESAEPGKDCVGTAALGCPAERSSAAAKSLTLHTAW